MKSISNTQAKYYIDIALLTKQKTLIVVGWLFDPNQQTGDFCAIKNAGIMSRKSHSFSLKSGQSGVEIDRVARLDVVQALSADVRLGQQFGFVLVVPDFNEDHALGIQRHNADPIRFDYVVQHDYEQADELLKNISAHSGWALQGCLRNLDAVQEPFVKWFSDFLRESIADFIPKLPTHIEQAEYAYASIDKAYPLGKAGLLIYGWKFHPERQPKRITLHGDDGSIIDVDANIQPLIRDDVRQGYAALYPELGSHLGVLLHADMPTNEGDLRALRFDFGEFGDVWIKVPVTPMQTNPTKDIRDILTHIQQPQKISHRLSDIFDNGLGAALEAINQTRQRFNGKIQTRKFGKSASNADVSVIIPLYGRYDFLRHQLAQFADDADFQCIDLIYVIDDPNIITETQQLAARYHELFGVSFRLAWYDKNLGFAGANNVGAALALGKYLLLCNSDVIPQHAGWVNMLVTELETLPNAGIVGPLLQFFDDSVQHAGMYPRTDSNYPGFLLNTHKGMGMSWEGGETSFETPMLTAACVLMRRKDYDDLGGLDEGYLIGDFEDADLCLALRKLDKRVYLAPIAKLWHLERQSQSLDNLASIRQMITLFNGWRYHKKIKDNIIADPREFDVNKVNVTEEGQTQ